MSRSGVRISFPAPLNVQVNELARILVRINVQLHRTSEFKINAGGPRFHSVIGSDERERGHVFRPAASPMMAQLEMPEGWTPGDGPVRWNHVVAERFLGPVRPRR